MKVFHRLTEADSATGLVFERSEHILDRSLSGQLAEVGDKELLKRLTSLPGTALELSMDRFREVSDEHVRHAFIT